MKPTILATGLLALAGTLAFATQSGAADGGDGGDGGKGGDGGNGGNATVGASAPETLRLVARTTSFTATTDPKRGPAAADVYAYTDSLSKSGKKIGTDHCFCVAVSADDLVCEGVLTLPHGKITFTQPFSNTTLTGTGAITGGTGRYDGASGTFTATGRAGTDPAVYDYVLRLKG